MEQTKNKGGRPRTGSAWRDKSDGRWVIQVTNPDGTRSNPHKLGPEITTEARARSVAAAWTERAMNEKTSRPLLGASTAASVEGWAEKWCDERERFGLTSVDDDRGRLRKWILPQLGAMAMRGVKRRDLETFVAWLDERVLAGDLAAGTAVNVWTLVQAMFRDASGMPGRRKGCPKLPHLVVRSGDNPARDIAGPNTAVEKSKTYLYPSEFLAVLSCERVPLRWRVVLAIGTYAYLRTGELEALQWEDVNLDNNTIHVHRGIDRDTDEEKGTKTGRARYVPIEPTLRPLLVAMRAAAERAAGADVGPTRVVTMPPLSDLADRVRRYLGPGWADMKRAALFANDRTRKRLGFYDATRGTGITWRAIRGDEPLKIRDDAGHERFETTDGYIKEARSMNARAADVFPPLPPSLLRNAAEGIAQTPSDFAKLGGRAWEKRRPQRDSNPPGQVAIEPVSSGESANSPREAEGAEGASTDDNRATPNGPAEPPQRNPRAALLADLAARLVELGAAGDVEGARLVHETMGRLLGGPAPTLATVTPIVSAKVRR